MNPNDQLRPEPAPAVSSWGSTVRAAAFEAVRPALEALAREAGADPRLSAQARRVLRAVTGTRPEDSLALPALAARSSTPKTRVPTALAELESHGYLARLASIAPHLTAALPTFTTPAPESTRPLDAEHNDSP